MANHVSSLKRIRQTEKRRIRNRRVRQTMRTRIKQARNEISENTQNAKSSVHAAIAEIDKAASKGVIHKRAAARRISRLAKQANKITGK